MIINLNNKISKESANISLSPDLERYLELYKIQYSSGLWIDSINALDKIDDRIYIGGETAASNRHTIDRYDISHILNLAVDSKPYDHSGIRILKAQIEDSQIAPDGYFESIANLISSIVNNHTENIMVHCVAGISRSVTAVMSYLLLHKQLKFYDALSVIQSARPCASPHPMLVYSILRDFGDRINL
jgi:predicted protein tyrosine phosphatase